MSSESARRSRSRAKPDIVQRYEGDDGETFMGVRLSDSVNKFAEYADENVTGDYTDELPTLPLPAHGEEYPDCGEDVPVRFCRECGKPQYGGRTCGRSVCPRCWKAWVRNRAVGAGAKLMDRLYDLQRNTSQFWKLHHVIASAPDGFAVNSEDPLSVGFEVVKELAGEVGIEEGIAVYHPYRIKEEHRGDVLGHQSGGGDLHWKDIIREIESGNGDFEEIEEEYLVHEPHFHIFCPSVFVAGQHVTKSIEKQTGWLVHRVARDDGVSLEDRYDLARALGYCLTHAGLYQTAEQTRAAYRYFGEVSNHQAADYVEDLMTNSFAAISERILGEKMAGVASNDQHNPDREGDDAAGDPCDDGHHKWRPIREGRYYYSDIYWRKNAKHSRRLGEALEELEEYGVPIGLGPPKDPPD